MGYTVGANNDDQEMNHAIVENARTSVTSEPSRIQSNTSLNKGGQELNQVVVENTDQGSINYEEKNVWDKFILIWSLFEFNASFD